MAAAGQAKQWTSRAGFLLASIGFAVGLGNIWRFPYVTGENGGAAFVLVYLVCAFAIGVPIVIAEIMIGRRGKASAAGSMQAVAKEEKKSPRWVGVGYMGQLTAFLIQVTYAVVCGWVLWYLFKAIMTGFVGVDADISEAEYSSMLSDTGGMLFWTTVSLLISGFILYAGVTNGIERAVTIMMPSLFALLVILVIFNMFAGGFTEAIAWLFTPDFSKIDGGVVLAALGQAFFSVGVGMAALMTYGSYLPDDTKIASSAIIIVLADTMVALMAGLVIFPAVFNNGLDPASGVGLIFQTLPVAFAQMQGGYFFAILFFLLLSFAGITSMVGLLEAVISWFEDSRGYSRHRATLTVVGANIVLSAVSVMGYTIFSGVEIFGKNINGATDYFSSQILLPVGGLLVAVFAGWFIHKATSRDELKMQNSSFFALWHFLLRWPVPIAVAVIFIIGTGLLDLF